MRVLGVNGSTSSLWLALVDDDREVVAGGPTHLSAPENASVAHLLDTVRAEATRLLESHRVERVRVLDAETNGQPSYAQLAKRIGMETAFMLAAHDLQLDVDRITRARLRSVLQLGNSGRLTDLASGRLVANAPHWANKRDLAALAAMAGLET
jgi:hypothetical protein